MRLDLSGLLYHIIVDTKDILAGINLQPPTHLINYYVVQWLNIYKPYHFILWIILKGPDHYCKFSKLIQVVSSMALYSVQNCQNIKVTFDGAVYSAFLHMMTTRGYNGIQSTIHRAVIIKP